MAIGVTLLIIIIAVVAIYFLMEFKRFRHKIFAIFLIALILFVYLSASYVLKGKNVDVKTASGLMSAIKIYWNWLVYIGGNLKTITSNAIHMSWGANQTAIK